MPKTDHSPVFYKLTAPDGQVAWLYGAIHLPSVRCLTLPSEVIDKLDAANKLVVELDVSSRSESQQIQEIKKIGDEWQVKNNHPFQQPKANPYVFNIEKNDLSITSRGGGVDAMMIDYAKKKEKEIVELETLSEQLKTVLFFDFNAAEREKLFLSSGANKKTSEKLISSYLGEQPIIPKKPELEEEKEISLDKKFMKNFFYDRDECMAERLIEKDLIKDGNFITVGYAHLPGIVDNLAKQGYSIEPIPLGERNCSLGLSSEDNKACKDFLRMVEKTYDAMYEGQTSLFKTKKRPWHHEKWLNNPLEAYARIRAYAENNPDSRTAAAFWAVFKMYQSKKSDFATIQNVVESGGYDRDLYSHKSTWHQNIYQDIYDYAFSHSNSLFRRGTSSKREIQKMSIDDFKTAPSGTRRSKIYNIFGGENKNNESKSDEHKDSDLSSGPEIKF